jgi:hypothetical protein
MSSPEVWADARARLEAGGLSVPFAWPNEAFTNPEPPAPWLLVEISGDLSAPLELGRDGVWQEDGAILVHVMVPTGTGVTDGLALRKAVANLFRGLPPGPVTYHGATFDPGGPGDDTGVYHRLSLSIRYRYQDR